MYGRNPVSLWYYSFPNYWYNYTGPDKVADNLRYPVSYSYELQLLLLERYNADIYLAAVHRKHAGITR